MMPLNISSEQLPGRDIVCAFNYSCCCLHKRKDLVMYFKHVLGFLSRRGGIFVMDLYGGTSSEQKLRLQRRFANFKYVWEQAEFDMIERKTRISLHFHLQKPQKKLPHAFSYSWRLWSLPEIKDCLEEAGFQSVHFWIRQMPDSENIKSVEGFGIGKDVKCCKVIVMMELFTKCCFNPPATEESNLHLKQDSSFLDHANYQIENLGSGKTT
ncbi:hypothetical protein NL676_013589 [Syzygium grande]|nr:hypothetical protein NL676_013589 [Syzygium grande]